MKKTLKVIGIVGGVAAVIAAAVAALTIGVDRIEGVFYEDEEDYDGDE